MGLASTLSTALTGMNAAETSIDVVGNNLANADTVGFKASMAEFATQFSQTQSLGSAPTANNGGTNPTQIGLGTMVADITPNFSQGTITTSSSPSDLAIQGNGMFIMEGLGGEQLYTRNGQFQMNANNQLVNASGYNLLGYGVNGNFDIDTSTLTPLSIPLGTATVAQATQNVVLQGSLTPTGTLANQASILETGVLGDAQYTRPVNAATVADSAAAGSIPAGTYQYYVTYVQDGVESRPSPISLPISVGDNSSIQVTITGDNDTSWSDVNVYRNDSTDANTFHLVQTFQGGASSANPLTFTDTYTDAQVDNGATLTNMNGPPITTATLLTNLVSLDSQGNYDAIFPDQGTLGFTGNLGGSDLTTKNFQVSATSTVGDLLTFMQQAMGIQTSPGPDPANPIPPDATTGLYPGGSVTVGSQLQFVGNNGTGNAIAIPLSGLQLTTDGVPPTTESINLPFSAIQQAQGQSASTNVVAYDSLGIPLSVNITAVLQDTTSSYTEYRWFADCGDNDPATGAGIAVGTGLIRFGSTGDFLSATNSTVTIDRTNEPSVKPMQFQLDFSNISGLATSAASLAVTSQDGSAPGTLSSYQIGQNGVISGVFSNGITRDLGQIALANFTNPAGLEQQGQNMYAAGVNSGLPVIGAPGANGNGTIQGGALEESNADVGTNLIDLITASTMYQANSRVITTTQQLFNDLLTLQQMA
ncbi:MAG: flagellar hook-basal body complex protein [Thermoguttaceae bacterium]